MPEHDLDLDIWRLNDFELAKEVLRLRGGIRKFLAADGNDLCHENRVELAEMLPEKPCTKPRPLPFFRFMLNCFKYRIGLSRYCSACKRT